METLSINSIIYLIVFLGPAIKAAGVNDMFQDFDYYRDSQDVPSQHDNDEQHVAMQNIEKELKSCHENLVKVKNKECSFVENEHATPVSDYSYYKRTLSLLWQSLQLETIINGGASSAAISVYRQMSIDLSIPAIHLLHQCLYEDKKLFLPQKCDEAVSTLLETMTILPDEPSLLNRILDYNIPNIWETLHSPDVWLYFFASTIFLCSFVALCIMFNEFRKNRRWGPFFIFLFILLFVFCWLWNLKLMTKEEEARRLAEYEKRSFSKGFQALPGHCKQNTGNILYDWLGIGTDNECKKYFEDMMISANEKITPEAALMRTLETIFLSPLKRLGQELGRFFAEFYKQIPFLYLLPASIMLTFFMMFIILILFGYELHLPFFLGGIRPTQNPNRVTSPVDNSQYLQIRDELREEQRKILKESLSIMQEVKEAALSSALRSSIVEPVISSSSRSIERRLDRLINSRLDVLLSSDGAAFEAIESIPAPCNSPVKTGKSLSYHQKDHLDGRSLLSQELQKDESYSENDKTDSENFQKSISELLESSLNLSQGVNRNDQIDNITPRKKSKKLDNDINCENLSPASKKFLTKVKDIMESD